MKQKLKVLIFPILAGDYKVTLSTGKDKEAGTESLITLSMCGSVNTVSTDLPQVRNGFQPGSVDTFPVGGNNTLLPRISLTATPPRVEIQ